MGKEQQSFILYYDQVDMISEFCTDEEAGILLKAIGKYARDRTSTVVLPDKLQGIYYVICCQLNRDRDKYIEKCVKNQLNAQKAHKRREVERATASVIKKLLAMEGVTDEEGGTTDWDESGEDAADPEGAWSGPEE